MPAQIQQPAVPLSDIDHTTCTVTSCDKKINRKCARHACAAHCRLQGGCSLVAHAPKNSELSQTLSATFYSQPNLSTGGIDNTFVSTAQQDSSAPMGDDALSQNRPPPPTAAAMYTSAGYRPPPPIPPHPVQLIASGPHLEPPTSMNPLPNPRYSSQIRPIFTEELARKQELLRMRQIQETERLDAVKRAKHTVTVYAWLSVGLL